MNENLRDGKRALKIWKSWRSQNSWTKKKKKNWKPLQEVKNWFKNVKKRDLINKKIFEEYLYILKQLLIQGNVFLHSLQS